MTSYWLQDTWGIFLAAARIFSFCATLPFSSFLYPYLCRAECLLEEADPKDWSSFKAHTRRISMLSNAVCSIWHFCRGVARFRPRNRDLLTVEKWIHTVDIEPAPPKSLELCKMLHKAWKALKNRQAKHSWAAPLVHSAWLPADRSPSQK